MDHSDDTIVAFAGLIDLVRYSLDFGQYYRGPK